MLFALIFISCDDGDDNANPPVPQVSNTNFEAEETFSLEALVENRAQFRLHGKTGGITITGQPGALSVTITGTKRVQSESTQDAQAHLQDLTVNMQSLPNEIFVETFQPQDQNTGGREYIVDYTITLPQDLQTHVNSISGTVTLDSINNNVSVNNVGGSVTLKQIVGGALINVLGGTIESEITLPLNGSIDLNTLNGDINLTIPLNTSAGFSATVTLGTITAPNLVLQNETRTSTFLGGTLGSGQGTITLEIEQIGNIRVTGI